jgi:hypothetical protein
LSGRNPSHPNSLRRATHALLLAASVGLSLILNLVGLGDSSLFSDEAIYAVSARNVAVNGPWYPLEYLHRPFVAKPPLAVWPVALSFQTFGVNEFSDRLPSAIAATLLVALVYLCAAWILDEWSAFFAAALLATCLPWLAEHGARNGVSDPLLSLLLAAALVSYFGFRASGARLLLLASGAAGALSGLCKGFLGPCLLLTATLVVELVWSLGYAPDRSSKTVPGASKAMRNRLLLGSPPGHIWHLLRSPLALFMMSVSLYLIWLSDTALRVPGYLSYLYADTFTRALNGIDTGHIQGPTYYAYILSYAFEHWGLILLPLGGLLALRNRDDLRSRALALAAVWAIVVVGLLSFSVSKLPWYIFPAFPAIAILIAAGVREIVRYLCAWRGLGYAAMLGFGLLLGERVDAAWNLVHMPPRIIQMQRFAEEITYVPDARLYADDFDKILTDLREWNAFYLEPLRARTQPYSAPDIMIPGCRAIITERPAEVLQRPEFRTAAIVQIAKYDAREANVAILDLCGGKLRAMAATAASVEISHGSSR